MKRERSLSQDASNLNTPTESDLDRGDGREGEHVAQTPAPSANSNGKLTANGPRIWLRHLQSCGGLENWASRGT
jgi:hypothetical protein